MAKQPLSIVIYQDRRGGWRFRITAKNGRVVAQGESYTRKASAKRGADRVLARG